MLSRKIRSKIFGILLLELQLIITHASLNIFIQYFAVKCKDSCWIKQDKVFPADITTLINCCYKATFKHDDISNTYNLNSTTSIDFIFFYSQVDVMKILQFLGNPCLFLNFRQKMICLYTYQVFFKENVRYAIWTVGTWFLWFQGSDFLWF